MIHVIDIVYIVYIVIFAKFIRKKKCFEVGAT